MRLDTEQCSRRGLLAKQPCRHFSRSRGAARKLLEARSREHHGADLQSRGRSWRLVQKLRHPRGAGP